jgi:hypothetical protein
MTRMHVGSRRGWKANRRTRPIRAKGALKYMPREPYWRGSPKPVRDKTPGDFARLAAAEAKRERRRNRGW